MDRKNLLKRPLSKKRVIVYWGAGFSILLAAVMTLILSSAWVAGQKTLTLGKQMEEMEEAQLRQKEMIKASKVGLWDWDLVNNQVRYSEEWKNQIGYENREIEDDFKEFEKRVHPDYRDNGRFAGVLGIGRDITERKRSEKEREKLQAQLIQAQRMESVGRLAGGVAHDI